MTTGVSRAKVASVPLVIGIGNPFRGDDGCGLAVARALRKAQGLSAEVEESDGEPTHLLDLWQERGLVIVVDAIQTGSAPGTVLRFDMNEDSSPPTFSVASTHGLSLSDGIALGRSLGCFPRRLLVFGIEATRWEMGSEMSPPVAAAVPRVASLIEAELQHDAAARAGGN